MSPNLVRNAPRLIQWYYEHGAMSKGQDWFIMPPSGWLYSYPGEMPDAVQVGSLATVEGADPIVCSLGPLGSFIVCRMPCRLRMQRRCKRLPAS